MQIKYSSAYIFLLTVSCLFLFSINKTLSQTNDFCGFSTNRSCQTNADCHTDGCSGQVCAGENENIITTCEYRDCYNANSYGLTCGCINNYCQWNKATSTNPACGNNRCETGESSICPACYYSVPACLAPCTVGSCPEDCRGDLNIDSGVNVIDLGIFLSNWGSTSRPSSDLNSDGNVNVIDLGILLSNWG
jgi:eight-cysteine-cluster-containing protein